MSAPSVIILGPRHGAQGDPAPASGSSAHETPAAPFCGGCSLPLDFAPAADGKHVNCWPAIQIQAERMDAAIRSQEAAIARVAEKLEAAEEADEKLDHAYAALAGGSR